MKTIIAAVISIVLLMGAPSAIQHTILDVFALSVYQSGYNHGCNDVNKLPDTRYINSIGHEASHHTVEFMNGYHQGFKACGGSEAEDSSGFLDLKPGQHYGQCEAVGPNNELGCDILNDDGSPNPPTLEDGTPNVPTTLDPCRNIPANLTCHVVGGDPSLAQTNYDSGYKLGVYDAKLDKANKTQLDFVSQPGKELSNYTRTLKDGYAKGWCTIMGPNTGTESHGRNFECNEVLKADSR